MLTVGELREWLDNFGDHVPVMYFAPNERAYEIEPDPDMSASLNGVPVAAIYRGGEIEIGGADE